MKNNTKSIHSYVFSIYIYTKEIVPLGWKWERQRDTFFYVDSHFLNSKIIKKYFLVKIVPEKSLSHIKSIWNMSNYKSFLRSSLKVQTGDLINFMK